MKHTDIFERASDWNARGDSLRLRPAEWMLLEAIDGWRSMGDLLRGSELDLPAASAIVTKLERLDLIRRAEYTWEEYRRRRAGDQPTAPAMPPAAVAPEPPEPSEPPAASLPVSQVVFGAPPAPEAAPAAQVRFRLGARPLPVAVPEPEPISPPEAAAAPAIAAAPEPAPVVEATAHAPRIEAEAPAPFPLPAPLPPPPVRIAATVPLIPPPAPPASLVPATLPPPAAPAQESDRPLALRAVLDFVIARAGGGTKGQLAVYRTFLKVPMHLLRESGIKSLNVATSDIVIADPQLKDSILRAVESVVGEPFSSPASRAAA